MRLQAAAKQAAANFLLTKGIAKDAQEALELAHRPGLMSLALQGGGFPKSDDGSDSLPASAIGENNQVAADPQAAAAAIPQLYSRVAASDMLPPEINAEIVPAADQANRELPKGLTDKAHDIIAKQDKRDPSGFLQQPDKYAASTADGRTVSDMRDEEMEAVIGGRHVLKEHAPEELQRGQPEAVHEHRQGAAEAAPMSDYDKSYFAQGMSGANEGVGKWLGSPVDLVNAGIGLGMAGVNKAFGTDYEPAERPFLGSRQINEWLGNLGSIKPETDDGGTQFVRRLGNSVGAAVLPGGYVLRTAAHPLRAGASLLGASIAGGTGAATAQKLFPDNPYAEMAGEILGSLGAVGAIAIAQKASANSAARNVVPIVEKLEENAGKLYGRAETHILTAPRVTKRKRASNRPRTAKKILDLHTVPSPTDLEAMKRIVDGTVPTGPVSSLMSATELDTIKRVVERIVPTGTVSSVNTVRLPAAARSPTPRSTIDVKEPAPYDLELFPAAKEPPSRQYDLERYSPVKGTSERVSDLVRNKYVQDRILDIIANGKRMGAQYWHVTGPLHRAYVEELGRDAGDRAFRQYINILAATSPRSKVGINARNASYYQSELMQGRDVPEIGSRNPYPYGHWAQSVHQSNVRNFLENGWVPLIMPKTHSFAENMLGNHLPVALDSNAFRLPAMLSQDVRFLRTDYGRGLNRPGQKVQNIRKMVESDEMSMEEALRHPAYWVPAPNPNEYEAMELFFKGLAREAGLPPGHGQAAAWIGGGELTGLASDPNKVFMGFLEDQILKTAVKRGFDPKYVLKQFIRGDNPLLGLGAVLFGGAALKDGETGPRSSSSRPTPKAPSQG